MMPRRSFLEAAVWLAAAGSLAGCSSDGTAGFARGSAPGPVTADTPIYDVINNPLLDGTDGCSSPQRSIRRRRI